VPLAAAAAVNADVCRNLRRLNRLLLFDIVFPPWLR